MLVPVLQKNFPEERAARAQDHFVRGELLVALASQRHVGEVLVREQTLESRPGTGLELVPSQVEVLWVSHRGAKFWRERSWCLPPGCTNDQGGDAAMRVDSLDNHN